ncbi:alpha/beta fold hydrolase [Polyangium spumosum]|uniref:Abhydrolase domain-containing 18 n=1 Tax=Polyangium spumosum TaxID=889282 RepID=A0A6N7PQF6_9BACT|nr:hypothetical protein [Polyangium spumosum]MRG94442.1 hypothetical protein [Polyangium spumosum]
MVLRRILTTAASGFDKTVGTAMLVRGERIRSADPSSLGPEARLELLEAIRGFYDKSEHFTAPSSFFGEPTIPNVELSRVRLLGGPDPGMVLDATWPSEFEPFEETVRADYLGHELNRKATARLFLHGTPRPVAILVHGYRCGVFALEERLWPVPWIFELGLDVALAVLPFHACRAPKGTALFPSPDMRFTIEGFRQSIMDLRALAALLRDRGAPAVGVMGMSLGGYTSGLWATIDPSLAFAVPIVPCASIADVARAVGLLVGAPEEQAAQHLAIESTLRVVSPLARDPVISPEQMLVVGAAGDQITPLDHARRMAEHFRAPLSTFHGGHLLQFGRADAFRAVRRMLARIGIIETRHAAA